MLAPLTGRAGVRHLFLLLGLQLAACASVAPLVPEDKTGVESQVLQKQEQPTPPAELQISVASVGDIMLGTDYPEPLVPPEQGNGLLEAARTVLTQADITLGNLEGVFMQGGEPRKQCRDLKACYLFRMPPVLAESLLNAGFDALSLANNHARDFGEEGRDSTMRVLDGLGIRHSGRQGDVASWQVKGRRVVFIAFAPFIGAHDMLDIPLASQTVSQLAADHDIVIVSFHGGAEGEEQLHVPGAEEFFHGENRGDVKAFARAVIDAGADLVIGHGPHVPRALELYRDRLIAYSLGNFCTYWGINIRGANGLAPVLLTTLDGDGRFLGGRIASFRQFRPDGLKWDASTEAARLIERLTRVDFPMTPLSLSDEGQISPHPSRLAVQP